MTSIEQDVERVRAVHEALTGPQVVWVAKWSGKHDSGFVLFATEASARAQLLAWFDDEDDFLGMGEEEYKAARQEIVDGTKNDYDDEDTIWCSIESEVVHP